MFAYCIDDLTEAHVMVGRASRPPTELTSQPRRLRQQATALSTYLANINKRDSIGVAPRREESLAQAIGWTHWGHTPRINFREGWRGYLWRN